MNLNKPNNFPKIVHMIYIPWNSKTGILKDDEFEFDHTFYNNFKKNNPEWKVILWTLSKINKFISDYYLEYAIIWTLIKHPVQVVDFIRLLVVYHYGGIYWEYKSTQKTLLDNFIPSENKNIKLFVETIIDKNFSIKMKNEIIRNNKPEEYIRVAFHCFATYAKNDFINYCIKKSLNNLNKYTVINQYDILYIGGNAMITEAYHEFDRKNIELIFDTNKYLSAYSIGSWRMKSYT